ncbi:transposase [Mesorhizobium sp. ORM16]
MLIQAIHLSEFCRCLSSHNSPSLAAVDTTDDAISFCRSVVRRDRGPATLTVPPFERPQCDRYSNGIAGTRQQTSRHDRPLTASVIAADVPDASLFRSGRQCAAWLGLTTPRAPSSGGHERLMGISKQGDDYLRRLVVSALQPCCDTIVN